MAATANSAGTRDTRVDRIEEGLPGLATVENPTANPPSRATFDSAKATGGQVARQNAVIDTSHTSRLDDSANVKRARPAVW